MKNITVQFALLLCLTGMALWYFAPLETFAIMNSASYQIWADGIDSGGQEGQTSESYQLSETIGEPFINSATSTSDNFGIKSGFRELYQTTLTFSVSTTTIDLGILSVTATNSTSHTMLATTNHENGFLISVAGDTLTSGSDTITAIGGTAAASSIGSEQFGINLVDNATPDVGAAVSGTAPIGSAIGAYAVADLFAYQTGDGVASSTGPTNTTTYTLSYIANIAAGTEGGTYTTTLTYTAVGQL